MNTLREKFAEHVYEKPLPEGLPTVFSDNIQLINMIELKIGTLLTDGERTFEVVPHPGDPLGLDIKAPCTFCCFYNNNCTKSLDMLLSKARTVCRFNEQKPRKVFRLVEKEKSNDN